MKASGARFSPLPSASFTLLELLVTTAVLALLVSMLVTLTSQTGSIWQRTSGKIEEFRVARSAFEALTRRLGQATLNTYWDYDNVSAPTTYRRQSELRFISGPARTVLEPSGGRLGHCVFFQAPFGVTQQEQYRGFENMLSTWGYYLEFRDDSNLRPAFLSGILPVRYRFRLVELWQSAEDDKIYTWTSGAANRGYSRKDWFENSINGQSPPVHVIAENIVALVITPRLSQGDEQKFEGTVGNADYSPLAPDYLYDTSPPPPGTNDSRYSTPQLDPVHQLPPVLQVTMVAIDEPTAARLNLAASSENVLGVPDKFIHSGDYSKDLLLGGGSNSLESTLVGLKANYRIFSTNVIVRGAKWSRDQTN